MNKPDWNRIAHVFKTISITIHSIYKKIIEEIIYKVTIKLETPRKHPIITTEIREIVIYLVGSIPIIY